MSGRSKGVGGGHGQSEAGSQVDATGDGRELAVLVGGPKDRWWYWRDDLDRMQAVELRVAERQGDPHPERRPCSVLVYRPTERWLTNTVEPQYGVGRVWEHRLDADDDDDADGA